MRVEVKGDRRPERPVLGTVQRHVSHCVEWLVTPSPPTLVHGGDRTRGCTKGPSLQPQMSRRQPTFRCRGRCGEKEGVGCGTP